MALTCLIRSEEQFELLLLMRPTHVIRARYSVGIYRFRGISRRKDLLSVISICITSDEGLAETQGKCSMGGWEHNAAPCTRRLCITPTNEVCREPLPRALILLCLVCLSLPAALGALSALFQQ